MMGKNKISLETKRKYTYFRIQLDYDGDVVDRVRDIPSAEYNAKKGLWYSRMNILSAPIIYDLIKNYGFDFEDEVVDEIKNIIQSKKVRLPLSRAKEANIDIPELPNGLELKPFQKAGVKYLVDAKRCFLGDEMGLGKTVQALVAAEVTGAFPHIVICPATVKRKWRREVDKWLPHRSTAILNDDNFSYHHDIMILNYEVVCKYLVVEDRDPEYNKYKVREAIKRQDIKGLTVDESHYTKSRSSKRTKAVRKLSKIPEYVWLLSGTIIKNRPKEFITQLQILNRLTDLGGYQHFVHTYCDAEMGWSGHLNIDGSSNLNLLNRRLRSVCMARRLKDDVADQLPDKLDPKKIMVDIPDNVRKMTNMIKDDIYAYLAGQYEENKGNRLGLYDDNPIEERSKNEDAIELQIINELRKQVAGGKVNKAIKWIREFIKKEKLIVFAHHRNIQKRLIREFPGCARILGGMDETEKDKNERKFQETDCSLGVCSLQAAGEGIDLYAASNILFLELAWAPATHNQAEDRAHRMGQTEEVQPYYMLGKNTIDEDIYDLLLTKQKVVEQSLDGFSKYNEDANIINDLIERLKQKGEINIPQEDA